MLGAQGVSVCARVCQQQELGECVLSSTSALAVYGAQWGMWWGPLGALGCLAASRPCWVWGPELWMGNRLS